MESTPSSAQPVSDPPCAADDAEQIYVVECVWLPIAAVGYDVGNGQVDHIHVIADQGEAFAVAKAQEHSREYPLYPLSCWSPTDYHVVEVRPAGTLAPIDYPS
jgi:hypothetical protein